MRSDVTATSTDRLMAPERVVRRPRLALRQRASDHPMTLFATLGLAAFASMALIPTTGPAFAALNPPANAIEGARTTTKDSRLPMPAVDFACKGQAWGTENQECLRAIAEQSGTAKRSIRMIANAEPLATTPNIF